MRNRTTAAGVAIATCFLAGCGGASSGLPRTPANITVCKALADTLAGKQSVQQLAGAVLETNAPISHQLRQDVAQYAVTAASSGASAAQQAEAQAKQDCQGITG
ncbi:MAG: hypothetical protein ACLQFR_28960 [Streptosporangiaceae bacterium]